MIQQNKRRTFAAIVVVIVLLAVGFLAGSISSGTDAAGKVRTRTVQHIISTTVTTNGREQRRLKALSSRENLLTHDLHAVKRCLTHRGKVHCVKAIVH